jgi:hypothetical protein
MKMRRSIPFAVITGTLCLPACGHGHLVPAHEAKTVLGAPTAALSEENGVRVTVDADEWRGKTEELPVTPLKVRIVNHSGRSIKLLYEDFALEGDKRGRVYRALPLVPLEDTNASIRPTYASEKFFVAARHRDAYPTLTPWPQELPRDMDLYNRQYRAWSQGMPTREMQRLGLPEGVLADGGEVAGFLYFPDAGISDKRVHVKVNLDDSETAEPVATVDIPFRVE